MQVTPTSEGAMRKAGDRKKVAKRQVCDVDSEGCDKAGRRPKGGGKVQAGDANSGGGHEAVRRWEGGGGESGRRRRQWRGRRGRQVMPTAEGETKQSGD